MVGVTGPEEDRRAFRHWAAAHDWEVVAEAEQGFEQLTLSALRRWALESDAPMAVLYAHAKGARTDLNGTNAAWRQAMTSRLVGEWANIVPLLERHDAVGCIWKNRREYPQLFSTLNAGSGIFAGNFWWASRDYIRKLPEPALESRFDAEAWIGRADPDVIDMLPGWIIHMLDDGSVMTADLSGNAVP